LHASVYEELTNDLLYESNDSREILNGSFSLSSLPRFEYEVDVVEVRLKKPFFSGGGGWKSYVRGLKGNPGLGKD
jgi:hypothetical protein